MSIKKVVSIITVLFLICCILSSCGNADTEKKAKQSRRSQESTADEQRFDNALTLSDTITKKTSFSGGRAFVKYRDENGIEKTALIDTQFHVLFERDGLSDAICSDGLSYTFSEDDNEFLVINSSGKIVYSSSEKDFDYVIGSDCGNIVVGKSEKDINSVKEYFAVIGEDGAEFSPWIENDIITYNTVGHDEISYYESRRVEYLGDRVFSIGNSYMEKLIDLDKSIVTTLPEKELPNGELWFENGKSLAIIRKSWPWHIVETDTSFQYRVIETGDIKLGTSHATLVKNKVYCTGEDGTLFVIDSKGVSLFSNQYNSRPQKMVYDSNGCSVLMVLGADQKFYYAPLSSSGKLLFELTPGKDVSYTEEGFLYKTDDAQFTLYSDSGNVIKQYNEFSSMYEFDSGIALVEVNDTGERHYINVAGDILL